MTPMVYGGDAYGSASYGEAAQTSPAHERDSAAPVQAVLKFHVDIVPQLKQDPEAIDAENTGPLPPAAASTSPPVAAERLLRWLLPLKVQGPLLGDLAEMYVDTSEKFGVREARRLYWRHAVGSIAPMLRQAALRWSMVATAAEWLRRAFWS